jgi:hypothetical protein
MQAGKAEKQPPPTQLVTLLMQTPQLYARNTVRSVCCCIVWPKSCWTLRSSWVSDRHDTYVHIVQLLGVLLGDQPVTIH